jgi:hypothetical protein
MAHQNGGGTGVDTAGMIMDGETVSSSDGYGGAAAESTFEERPELLVAAAFVAGVLIGGLVSRLGR